MIKFEPENTDPTTVQKIHRVNTCRSLVYDKEANTFIYESVGGNKTVLFQSHPLLAKIKLESEFKK